MIIHHFLISKKLIKSEFAEIPLSKYNPKIFNFITKNITIPIWAKYNEFQDENNVRTLDLIKCHTNALLNMDAYTQICFDYQDSLLEYNGIDNIGDGLYYVKTINLNNNFIIPGGEYHSSILKELMEKNIYNKSHITHYIPASYKIKNNKNKWKNFIKKLQDNLEKKDWKMILNTLVGFTGIKRETTKEYIISKFYDLYDAYKTESKVLGNIKSITETGESFQDYKFFELIKENMKLENLYPFHSFVMSWSRMKLIELYQEIMIKSPGAIILHIKYDSITYEGKLIEDSNWYKNEEPSLQFAMNSYADDHFHYRDTKKKYINKPLFDELLFEQNIKYKLINELNDIPNNDNFMINAPPGCGKSYITANYISQQLSNGKSIIPFFASLILRLCSSVFGFLIFCFVKGLFIFSVLVQILKLQIQLQHLSVLM